MDKEERIVEQAKKSFLYNKINKYVLSMIVILCTLRVIFNEDYGIFIWPFIFLFVGIGLYIDKRKAVCPVCTKPISRMGKHMTHCSYCGNRLRYKVDKIR